MTDAVTSAASALQEATGALVAGQTARGTGSKIESSEAPELAYALTQNLDAMIALLQSVDLEPAPATSAEQSLRAVSQHIQQAAQLARRVATDHVPPFGPAGHSTSMQDSRASVAGQP